MKRLLSLLMALSLTLFIRCGSDDKGIDNPDEPVNPEDVTLEISTTDLTFEAKGGEKEFTITCNTDWTIANESAWCKTDITSGNGNKTVTVTAASYTETAERNTNLTVKAGNKTSILTVTQKSVNAIILSKNKFDIPQEGGDITVELKNDIDYQITIPADYQAWIKRTATRAAESQSVSFTIEANEEADKRTGYILFSGNAQKDTVFIYQAPKNILVLSEDTYTVPPKGAEITIELRTNTDYEVRIPDGAASWISLITTRALRTDRLTFRIEANTGSADRSAKIAVKDKNSDLSDTIIVIQPIERADIVWETEQDLIDFKAAGHTRIQGNIIVRGELKTLQKLDNLLTEIDGSLTLECPSLTSLEGLYNLAKITGNFLITKGSMVSFEGLNSLKSIGGDFEIDAYSSLSALESFEGLENLQAIGGIFKVTDHFSLTSLTSFRGLGSLKSIGGDFEIDAYSFLSALESFEGLENLQAIGGNFKVTAHFSLTSLTSFRGLGSLKSIGGDFEIDAYSSLSALESFEGLENLQTIGGNFKVTAATDSYDSSSLTSLASFKGLSSLKSIGGDFEIDAYSSLSALKSFEGLENLQTIGGNFKVTAATDSYGSSLTSLASFKGLSSLKSIGGKNLVIDRCPALRNIDDLKNVEALDEISITGCPKLYDFCILKNVVQNMSGTFYVNGNGYNPTKKQLLDGACSQTPPDDNNNNDN